ncbi:hypothetical protein SFRURICE_015383, partial [Spodoptera frugiperda]
NDISASDIRRRLLGVMENEDAANRKEAAAINAPSLERVDAVCRVIPPKEVGVGESMDEGRETDLLQTPSIGKREFSEDKSSKKTSVNQDAAYSSASIDDVQSRIIQNASFMYPSDTRFQQEDFEPEIQLDETAGNTERFRCVIAGVSVELSAASDTMPLLAVHLDRTALLMQSDSKCYAQIARDHTPRVCDGRIAHVATPLSNIGTMVNQRVLMRTICF